MTHDVLKVLIANLTALAVVLLLRRWHKDATHLGAFIITLTVVWAWFDGNLHIVQAIGCVLGVVLIGAEMSGKLNIKRARRVERLRDE